MGLLSTVYGKTILRKTAVTEFAQEAQTFAERVSSLRDPKREPLERVRCPSDWGLLHTLKGRTPLNYSGAMCTPPAFNFDREKNKIGRVGPVLAPSIQIRAARTLVPRLYFRPVSITYSFFFLSFAPGDALTLIFKYPHPRRPRCFNSPIESEAVPTIVLFENNLKS